ncbi:MAG: YggU family protein [Gemmatimonadota bacterium]|nr:YggU family protein [Gemmatimonadota bacterium]
MTLDVRPCDGGVRLSVHVQPRAARTEIAGEHGGALKIRLAAPPVDGAANDALVAFLAEQFGVPRRAVRVVSGHASRRKVVELTGVDAAAVRRAAEAP